MTTESKTRLADEHRRNISKGVKRRWDHRREVADATDEVVEAARKVTEPSNALKRALGKLDRALAGR